MGEKQSVQNFRWDGSAPRIEGKMVWFRSIDGSEHGWPQLTDHEAMRLALFLHGSQQRAASGVKVVRIVDVTKKYECCKATQLLPGQSLAIIERSAEAAESFSCPCCAERAMFPEAWKRHHQHLNTAEAAAGEGARMCYPFSTDTCTRPACTCRDEKAAARRAGEGEE